MECSCAGCRTVRVLNQKVSLLLIIHNATNSRHLSFPRASLNILAATQRGRKGGKKRTIYTQLSQWDEQTFVWITSADGGAASRHRRQRQACDGSRGARAAARPRKSRCEHAIGRLLLRPGIRQKCSGSRCLEERGVPETREEEEAGEGEAVVAAAEVGKEGCGG